MVTQLSHYLGREKPGSPSAPGTRECLSAPRQRHMRTFADLARLTARTEALLGFATPAVSPFVVKQTQIMVFLSNQIKSIAKQIQSVVKHLLNIVTDLLP